MGRTYIETFDDGPGGWILWGGAQGEAPLERGQSTVVSRSPWWIDPNHAPPGGGYLHLLFNLYTALTAHGGTGQQYSEYSEAGGRNSFAADGFPTDFTNASMTLRLKGELEAKGSRLVLLVQAKVGDIPTGQALTAQPFEVTQDWSEQTITLTPDDDQWLCLGARHDKMHIYGRADVADVLRDVTANILLVLHPVDVVPAEPIDGDPHILLPGKDYAADLSRLPSGHVMLDEVRIEFAGV